MANLPPEPQHRESPDENGKGDAVFASDSLTARPDESGNRKRGPMRVYRWIRRLVLIGVFLFVVLVAAITATVYLGRHWFRTEVEHRLMSELARQNVHLSYESAQYHFSRGLILNKVTLYETAERKKQLLTCSEMGFTFDVIDFAQQDFRGDVATSFTTWDADVVCFVEGEAVATITNLQSEIRGSSESVEVNRFRGQIGELDFDFEGSILSTREERRNRKERKDAESENGKTRKVADFAFFQDLMPMLAVKPDANAAFRPQIRASFLVDHSAEFPVQVKGRFTGDHFTWKEIPLDSAMIEFAFAEGDHRLRLPNFHVIYGGGLMSGSAVWNSETNIAEVERFQSAANLIELVRRVNPSVAPFAAMIQQSEPPLLIATGRLDLNDFWKSDLLVDYRHASGMTLLLNRGDLLIEGISGAIQVKEGRLATNSLKFSSLGGLMEVAGGVTIEPAVTYEGSVAVSALPLQSIVDYFGGEQEMPGLVTLNFQGQGGIEMVSLNGTGDVRLDGAKLYKVPVIGPVQNLMGSVVPVFGDGEKKSEMTATFAVTDGVLRSDDLAIRSDGTRVEVAGELDLSSWQTQFEAEGNLVGALGLVTGLVAKALVVEGSGRVDELDLKMKNVPAEFASETVKGIFGVAGQGVTAVADTVETGFEGAQQVAGGALKATGAVLGGGADAMRSVGQAGQKTVGEGVRVVGDGATAIGETGIRGIEGGARMVGQGAKKLGQGLMKIIPGSQKRDDGQTVPEVPEIIDEDDPEKPAKPAAPVIAD